MKTGETFTQSVVAVGQRVNAIIWTSLHFTESGLAEDQLARKIPAKCTNLTFNIVSPHYFEILTLYASDGSYKDADLSQYRYILSPLQLSNWITSLRNE